VRMGPPTKGSLDWNLYSIAPKPLSPGRRLGSRGYRDQLNLRSGITRLLACLRLLLAGCTDFSDDVADFLDGCFNFAKHDSRLVDEFGALAHFVDAILNQCFDFLGSSGTTCS
jgi:hypothetical protein